MSRLTEEGKRGRNVAPSSLWKFLRKSLPAYLLLAPAVILFVIFNLYPLTRIVVLSIYEYSLTSPVRSFVGLSNYLELLQDRVFWISIKNNVVILVGSLVLQVGGGLVLAALLERGIRQGRTFFSALIFSPRMMSTVAIGLLWQIIYDPTLGPLNRFLKSVGLPVPHLGWLGDPDLAIYSILAVASWEHTGFAMLLLLAGMQAISTELYEAAKIDGANEVQSFFFITIPSLRNIIAVTSLLTMIGAFKVFDLIWVLTAGGPANASQVLSTFLYKNAFGLNRPGYANAIGVVLLIIALVFGLIQLRVSRRAS